LANDQKPGVMGLSLSCAYAKRGVPIIPIANSSADKLRKYLIIVVAKCNGFNYR